MEKRDVTIKYIFAKDLLKIEEIKPFLLGALFSRIMVIPKDAPNNIPDFFYAYTDFKKSTKTDDAFDLENYADILLEQYNAVSGFHNWQIYQKSQQRIQLKFYIKNDLNIDSANFYKLIQQKLFRANWLSNIKFCENKKAFLRGFMETRGSVDTTARFIAQDYFYNNDIQLKRMLHLIHEFGIPISYINFNPRNLQPQFVAGISKRNAQLRINLLFYAKEIGFINKYKAQVFKDSYHSIIQDVYVDNGIQYFLVELPEQTDNVSCIKTLNFFTNNIYQKNISPERIKPLRQSLGFKDQQKVKQQKRDKSIIDLFRDISPDKCVLCGTTKTFTAKNGREHFEIHHLIPFHNGIKYDNIANLVKLCSTCHNSFKKGIAFKDTQIENIKILLNNDEVLYQYAVAALGYEDKNELSTIIQSMLG